MILLSILSRNIRNCLCRGSFCWEQIANTTWHRKYMFISLMMDWNTSFSDDLFMRKLMKMGRKILVTILFLDCRVDTKWAYRSGTSYK